MALSDYDLLAFNNDGKSCNGSFVVNNDIKLEIYKTYLCILDKKMYNKKSSAFSEPIIATINEGDVNIGNLNIKAKRSDDGNAIYFYSIYSEYKNKKIKKYYFAGIGCYGYYSKVKEYLAYKKIDIDYDWYSTGGTNYDDKNDVLLDYFIDQIFLYTNNKSATIDVDKEFGKLTEWIGITQGDIGILKSLLNKGIDDQDEDFEKWVKSIDWNSAKKMNMGDYFILSKLNVKNSFNKSASNINAKKQEPLITKLFEDKK